MLLACIYRMWQQALITINVLYEMISGEDAQGDGDQRDGRQAPRGVREPPAAGPRGVEGGLRQADVAEQRGLRETLQRQGKPITVRKQLFLPLKPLVLVDPTKLLERRP